MQLGVSLKCLDDLFAKIFVDVFYHEIHQLETINSSFFWGNAEKIYVFV